MNNSVSLYRGVWFTLYKPPPWWREMIDEIDQQEADFDSTYEWISAREQ